jgi:hypothetical protein
MSSSSEGPGFRHWKLLMGSCAALALALFLGAWGYLSYLTYVPPFDEPLPTLPDPNGYYRAAEIAVRVGSTPRTLPSTWPHGTEAELRAGLDPVRPLLEELRETLLLPWARDPLLSFEERTPEFAGFREAARSFSASSSLARAEGDDARAMNEALDAVALGGRVPGGGSLMARFVGIACHAIGMVLAEDLALELTDPVATRASLERVRAIREAWPSLAETIESERLTVRSGVPAALQQARDLPIWRQWDHLLTLGGDNSPEAWFRLATTPWSTALERVDADMQRLAAELRKPERERTPIAPPTGPFGQLVAFSFSQDLPDWRLNRPVTELALLEVALAVRLHRLTTGRYPTHLSELSREVMPAVPGDSWQQPVVYHLKEGEPVIYSLGPDGRDDQGLAINPMRLDANSTGDVVFGKLSPAAWRPAD